MKTQNIRQKSASLLLAVAFLTGSVLPFFVGHASAASFNNAYVRYNTLKGGSKTGGRVCVNTTSAVSSAATVRITFPTTTATNYTLSSTLANWATDTTNIDGNTAWPSISANATVVSGNTVTFTSGALSSGFTYCFNFGYGVSAANLPLTLPPSGVTESAPGAVAVWDSSPALLVSNNISESIVSDDTVTVNAVVPPSFSLALSGNTDNFASNLSITGTTATSGRTLTLATNAAQGYVVWAKDANGTGTKGALKSATAGNYLISGSTNAGTASRSLSNGSEDYGMGVVVSAHSGAGTTAADAGYDGTSSKVGSLNPTNFQTIATSSGTVNSDTLTFTERATISGATPAANDYTDVIQFVGAGRF